MCKNLYTGSERASEAMHNINYEFPHGVFHEFCKMMPGKSYHVSLVN